MTPRVAISPGPFGPLHATVENYYSRKVRTFGATPLGVDWSCVPTQDLRFIQLLRLCDLASPVSLNDLGCGYGALLAHIDRRHAESRIDYLGVDLSPAMITRAKRLWRHRPQTRFMVASASPRRADYSLASGIFNVALHHPREAWEALVADTLQHLHATSRRGFAVNFVAQSRGGRPATAGLYRTSPDHWARFCETTLGASVELVQNYGMDEFSLLVRPSPSGNEPARASASAVS